MSETRDECLSSNKDSKVVVPAHFVLFRPSGIGWCPPTLWGWSSLQSTESNVNVFQKCLTDTEKLCFTNYLVNLTHKIYPHIVVQGKWNIWDKNYLLISFLDSSLFHQISLWVSRFVFQPNLKFIQFSQGCFLSSHQNLLDTDNFYQSFIL